VEIGISADAVRAQFAAHVTMAAPAPADAPREPPAAVIDRPVPFVCEEDVRQAVKAGRKIVIGERTIVTPAARDLARTHATFVDAGWPGPGGRA
jgi:hypothetical protein